MVLSEIKDPKAWVNQSGETVTVLFIKHGDNRMQIFSSPGGVLEWAKVEALLQEQEFAGAEVDSMISIQPDCAIPPPMYEER